MVTTRRPPRSTTTSCGCSCSRSSRVLPSMPTPERPQSMTIINRCDDPIRREGARPGTSEPVHLPAEDLVHLPLVVPLEVLQRVVHVLAHGLFGLRAVAGLDADADLVVRLPDELAEPSGVVDAEHRAVGDPVQGVDAVAEQRVVRAPRHEVVEAAVLVEEGV